jgi:predicted metalloprotease
MVLPEVDAFFSATYQDMPRPANVYFIPDGATMPTGCVGQADESSYFYCADDDSVYIGQAMAWTLYSQAGDIAPAIGLAHEFGHDVQTQTDVPAPQTSAQTLIHEDQADCVSGAWFAYASSQGWLEPEDVPSTVAYLQLIASSENDPNRTHGDFQERSSAFAEGMNDGLSACNAYYSIPIYQA